jgi:hypothetical protein
MSSMRFRLCGLFCLCAACCTSNKKQECWLPGPCQGPPGLLIVGFKNGTTQAEIDAVNASVNGKVVWPGMDTEQLHVSPADECAAIERLSSDPHVLAVEPEIYLYITQPMPDASCPPGYPTFDASSCYLDDGGGTLICEDGRRITF